jgi:hypothetical protein
MISIFTLNAENITSILGYSGEVFSDLKLLIFVVAGLIYGLWIADCIASYFRKSDEK